MSYKRLTVKEIQESPEAQLRGFRKTKDFLVAIDTDGCVTDNMNGKQMLIFHPHYMEFYGLWGIESYFREVAEYYNLFSLERGCNRFIAVQLTLRALQERKDVQCVLAQKLVVMPDSESLDRYIAYVQEKKRGLGNTTLQDFLSLNPTSLSMYKLLGWSEAVNRTFPHISAQIVPFNGVRESLEIMSQNADIIVVSQTPYDDLADYWEANGLTEFIELIAGQEMGSKGHHIEVAKERGEYPDCRVMMIGDGTGDLKAVKKAGGLFYPVSPGKEQESWNRFSHFFSLYIKGAYAGEHEETLCADFHRSFLKIPRWKEEDYDHTQAYREKQSIRMALYEKYNPGGRLLVL